MNQILKFEHIKEGDEVILSRGRYGQDEVEKVERTTATQIILVRDRRFYRKDGYGVGYRDSWYPARIKGIASPEERTRLETERKHRKLREHQLNVGEYDHIRINEVYDYLLKNELIKP